MTLAICLCACLLAALAYLAFRTRLQGEKIRRLALERLRLETELALLTRELQESNRAHEEALRKIDELLLARQAAESAAAVIEMDAADMIDVTDITNRGGSRIETAQSEAAPPAPPAELPIWSDIDTVAVVRLCNLRNSGPPDLYGRLVELFESGSARALVELRTALEGGRFQDAAAVSHKFASSAVNVGALTFAQSVRELERLCLAADAGHAWGLYLRLRAAHAPLMVILQGKRLKASA